MQHGNIRTQHVGQAERPKRENLIPRSARAPDMDPTASATHTSGIKRIGGGTGARPAQKSSNLKEILDRRDMDDQLEFDLRFENMKEDEDLLMNDAEADLGDLREGIDVASLEDVDILGDDPTREATESYMGAGLRQAHEDHTGRPGTSTPQDFAGDGDPFAQVVEVDEVDEVADIVGDAFQGEGEERRLRGSIVGVSGPPDEFNLSNMNKKATSHEAPSAAAFGGHGGGASGIGGGASGIGGGASRIGGGAARIGAGFASGLKKPTAQQHAEPAPPQ